MKRARVLFWLGLLACVTLSPMPVSAARLQRWLYYPVNLWVNSNVTNLALVLNRAAVAGYTHLLLSDSKFSHLGDMDARYFANVNYIRNVASSLGIEIVPAVFPVGYSNDLLFNDPNLIEALPVTNVLLVVSNGIALAQPDPPVAFRGGDFSNLGLWDWHDTTVISSNGAACVVNPNGQNARIVQSLAVAPFRQYHVSVRARTLNFLGTPEVKVLGSGRALNYASLGVQHTEDWTTHHVVFNSLTNRSVTVYFGCWDGSTGTLFWDDAAIEEVAFLNLVRRPGAPLSIQIENGTALVEGNDFPVFKDPSMGVYPWNGCYDVYHTPPLLSVNTTNGTRLRASYSHAVTVYDGQAMICPSEPATTNLLWDQARRVHAAFQASGYMMSHDEIRVMNWCPGCQQRHLDAGAMLADNVRTCIDILRQVNPGGHIYVWSDMFDPFHNAQANYYLVRGDLRNSWLGLDPQVTILPWNIATRTNTLQFFSGRGHQQVLAGYYDSGPDQIATWLNATPGIPGVLGVMYTTWAGQYADLSSFGDVVSDFEIHHSWQLSVRSTPTGMQVEFPAISGHAYTVMRSPNLADWTVWTNFTSSASFARCPDASTLNHPATYYQAMTAR